MCIPNRCAKSIRENGYDVIHLAEQELYCISDDQVHQKAKEEGRVILTFDLDFSDIAAKRGSKLPSIIIFRLSNKKWENIIFRLSLVLEQYCSELIEGAIISVGDKKIRLRKLPLTKTKN